MTLTKKGAGAGLVAGPRILNKGAAIMQSVEITRATVAAGRRVGVGEVVELPDFQAVELINMGKAVPIVDAPTPENREDEVEKKVSKRSTRKKRAPKKKE